jgi:crotonobetaine/carnitine-CoA ligase
MGAGVAGLLREAACQRGSAVFSTGVQGRLTIDELDAEAEAAAAWLLRRQVQRGQRVAVLAGNDSLGHLPLVMALAKIRATWVPVNPRLTGDSLRHVLTDSDPSLIVVDPRLRAALPALRTPVVALEPNEWPAAGRRTESEDDPDDVLMLIYTSGTTGEPKGVQVTDRMWVASARGALTAAGAGEGDCLLMWEPWCHIGGAQVLLLPLLTAVRLAILERFSASTFWQSARQFGATHIHHLGGIAHILLRQEPRDLDRDHGVRVSWGGGMDAATWRAMEERFGLNVHECYGMTETSSVCTVNTDGPQHGVGRVLPDYAVRVVDDNGHGLPSGHIGQLLVRGDGLITPGYFRRPQETAAARQDGWWNTGDLGRLDENGYLHFHGRASDTVRRRGENISASWVEQALLSQPDVAEAAVVGVPSDLAEEEILAYVVTTRAIPPSSLVEHCRDRLAPFEVPRFVRIVAELPKTPSQRVIKGKLSRSVDGCYDALEPRGDDKQREG